MKLQTKLISVVVPLIALPLLIIGWLGYVGLRETSTETGIREMTSVLDQLARNVDVVIRTIESNIELFSNSVYLEKYMLIDDESVRYNLMQPRLLEIFAGYQDAYPNYSEIRVILPDGYEDTRVTIDQIPNVTDEEADSPYFQALQEFDGNVYSVFFRNPDNQRISLLVAKKLYILDEALKTHQQQPFRGYLAVTVDLEFIEQQVNENQIGKSGEIFLTDGRGKVLFDAHEQHLGLVLSNELVTELRRAVDTGDAVTMQYDGDESVFKARSIHRDLLLVVRLPSAELLASSRELSYLVSVTLVFAILITCVLMLFILKRLVLRPIQRLNLISGEIGKGNLDVPVKFEMRDEVGDLARSFDTMRHNLRKTQSEVQQHQRNLEHKVEERTSELRNARDVAEAANRAKTQFLATMSHEIRTPINGVLGMTELLQNTALDQKQSRFAETIYRSGETLLSVINDILDFSKIEAGKLQLDDAPFDLRQLVEDLGEMFADRAHKKGVELICALPADMFTVFRGDSSRLRQVLTNLIGNAIKFTEQGEVIVRVVCNIKEAENMSLTRFEVRDTGIGVAPQVQAHIFDAFAQADGSTTRKFGGTGLGLSICKQLVKLMGGEIGIESAPGQGSTFWFTVCLGVESADALTVPELYDGLSGIRVLIVDDNATNREILGHHLGAWGAQHDCAESGPQALERLRSAVNHAKPYELAILDQQMPEMDGLSVARAIQAEPALAGLRLVMLSALKSDDGCSSWHEAGIASYLTKPVRQSELYNGLVTVLGQKMESPLAPGARAAARVASEPHLQGRVLLAEDNPVNQEVASNMLENLGCEVEVVENGRAALEAVSRCEYGLVLMDCDMPEMDGFQAIAALRQREQAQRASRRLPVVALTANALQGDRERCLAAGMDDYLSKPFHSEQLRDVLQRWLPEPPDNGAAARGLRDAHLTRLEAVADPPAVNPGEAAGATPTDATGTLDPNALASIRAMDADGTSGFLRRLAGKYADSSLEDLQVLQIAIADGDGEAVRKAVHRLKSSSANVGALRLAALCQELETMARAGHLDNAEDRLAKISSEHERVGQALTQECRDVA